MPRPAGMTALSLLPALLSDRGGQIDPARSFVITGRERHVDTARDGNLPYPMRAIRTADPAHVTVRRELAAQLEAAPRDASDPWLTADVPFERPPFTDVVPRGRVSGDRGSAT